MAIGIEITKDLSNSVRIEKYTFIYTSTNYVLDTVHFLDSPN